MLYITNYHEYIQLYKIESILKYPEEIKRKRLETRGYELKYKITDEDFKA